MRNLKFLTLLFLSISVITFSSCNKDDDDDDTQTVTPGNPTPEFNDADAVLAAVQVISYIDIPVIGGQETIFTDVATGGFFDPVNTDAYLDAGIIEVNDIEIGKLSNNTYIFPNPDNPSETELNLSTSSGTKWVVNEDGSATDVDAFTYTTLETMPGEIAFDGDFSTGTAGSALTVNIESAPFSDGILWVLSVGDQYVEKETSGSATSVTFSSAETQDMSGTGVLQVVAFEYEPQTFGGKKVYFVNERVLNQFIDF